MNHITYDDPDFIQTIHTDYSKLFLSQYFAKLFESSHVNLVNNITCLLLVGPPTASFLSRDV